MRSDNAYDGIEQALTIARLMASDDTLGFAPPARLSAEKAYNPRPLPLGTAMSPKSTVFKVELQVSDMDRHYYALHNLILAQHPSETDVRLIVRLVAFALYADERLEFGRGLSDDSEPDLWQRDYVGDIQCWIDLGQPDESRIRKACARSRHVVVVNYGGHASDVWWKKIAAGLARFDNLTVIDIDPSSIDALIGHLQRGMRLTAMIQDTELQLMSDTLNVALTPRVRMRAGV